jgi:hypothetical protein
LYVDGNSPTHRITRKGGKAELRLQIVAAKSTGTVKTFTADACGTIDA